MTTDRTSVELLSLSAFEQAVTHYYVQNNSVNIHCASVGDGPLIVLIHGFPDHWLGWWQVMQQLSKTHRVVAMDLRGYNLSDKPEPLDEYKIENLVGDVRAVIFGSNASSATIVGHDWGGFVAWHVAMDAPELVEKLIVLNMPHPWSISRELANNEHQRKASEYVRMFKHPLAHIGFPLEKLSFWVKEAEYKKRHEQAMATSSLNSMMNYYRANWPQEPYAIRSGPPPSVNAPTLIIHSLEDIYALPAGLNEVWNWIDGRVTIETLPGYGHFVHHENPSMVSNLISKWLA
jgi:epoxide hydrolase 4